MNSRTFCQSCDLTFNKTGKVGLASLLWITYFVDYFASGIVICSIGIVVDMLLLICQYESNLHTSQTNTITVCNVSNLTASVTFQEKCFLAGLWDYPEVHLNEWMKVYNKK